MTPCERQGTDVDAHPMHFGPPGGAAITYEALAPDFRDRKKEVTPLESIPGATAGPKTLGTLRDLLKSKQKK